MVSSLLSLSLSIFLIFLTQVAEALKAEERGGGGGDVWNKSEIEGSEDCNVTVPLDDLSDEADDDEGEMVVDDNITSPQDPIGEDPAWKELWKDVLVQSSQSSLNSSLWSLASSAPVEKFDFLRGCEQIASYGHLSTSPTEKPTHSALKSPRDVTYIPHRHCFLVSETFTNRIGIYEAENFNFVQWLPHPKTYKRYIRPTSLLSLANGNVFIVTRDNIEILDHNLEGFQFKPGHFSGLSEGDSGEIFSLICLRRTSKYCIQRLTVGPNRFYKWNGQIPLDVVDSFDNWKKSRPRFLTYSNKKLFITDTGLHKFYLVDLQTGSQQAFGYQGTNPGQLLQPTGIIADHSGHLLIADGNKRLSVYSEDGQFIKVALQADENLVAPQDIRRFKDFLIVMNSSTRERPSSGRVFWYQLPSRDSGLASPASESSSQ